MSRLASLHRVRFPLLVLGSLILLLVAGVIIAVLGERAFRDQMAREAGAQADLLASAVSGSLAFDDRETAQDYVDAVQVNPNVLAAAVYDADNRIVASFAREGETIPTVATPRERLTVFQEGRLYVVRPVVESGQRLGTARLRLRDSPPSQRLERYAGLLLLVGLAGLVVTILAFAQSALRRANRELARSNDRLQEQMMEREKAEEALRQSQKMEAIGRLTGGIAHDFNNLLMVASSGIELLDRTDDPAKRKRLSDGVRQAVERGATLTRQLLVFSRRSPLRTEVLDLGKQIEGLRFLLERSLREDIAVTLDLPEGLWRVEADPGELELALMNLAVNARDAMPEGGALTIGAQNVPGGERGHDVVCITVADTGTGMSEAVSSRVFEPFFTTKDVGRGTGLGLSQVYGFIQSSGGQISVASTEGIGTTFTICLPRTDKPPVDAASKPAAARGSPSRAEGRLLLVEDDDAVAAGVGHMLRDLGFTYVRAASAADALSMLETRGRFDLVLSDMLMPGGMNGLALGEEIRRRFSSLPVILTTGFSEAAADAERAKFKLLAKPYTIQELSDVVSGTLAHVPIADGPTGG